MNINEFDELIKKSNTSRPAFNPSIGLNAFDAQVKRDNTIVRTPPGYVKEDLLAPPAPIKKKRITGMQVIANKLSDTRFFREAAAGIDAQEQDGTENTGYKLLKSAASLTGGASPDNLPLGIGEVIKGYKDVYKNPESYSEFQIEDVLKAIIDTSKEFSKTPFQAGANFAGVPVKFNLPILGEVSNRQFKAANRINNGEDPLTVTAEEGIGSIFDTLFILGIANETFGARHVKVASTNKSGPIQGGTTTDLRSFKLYNQPTKTIPINTATAQKMMSQEAGLTTGGKAPLVNSSNFDPKLPSYFRMYRGPTGVIKTELVQIKPSYFTEFTKLFKSSPVQAPTTSLIPSAKDIATPAATPGPVIPPQAFNVIISKERPTVIEKGKEPFDIQTPEPEVPDTTPFLPPVVSTPTPTETPKAITAKEAVAKGLTEEQYVKKESFNPNSTIEYHISDNPNLVSGKSFAEQKTPTNIGERGFGGKEENIGQIFSTKNPQSWSAQLNYEGNKKPQYVYLVEVKNPGKVDIMDGLPQQSINSPQDVKILSRAGGNKELLNPSALEAKKISQLRTEYADELAKVKAPIEKVETPTEISTPEPFLPQEQVTGSSSKTLNLVAEDINAKIQEKADDILEQAYNNDIAFKEQALQEAKDYIKKTVDLEAAKMSTNRPEILVNKTQIKEMLSTLEEKIINLEVILKDDQKYLSFYKQTPTAKTSFLLKPSAMGLVESNLNAGDFISIDKENLKPKGTSLRAVDSSGGAMASKGGQPIGTFEQQTVAPDKSVADNFKLRDKVNELIKKYAERVGEGYLPRGANGVYYHGSTKNIRLNSMNNLSTAAHEITHYIDDAEKITPRLRRITGYGEKGNPIYDKETAPQRKDLTTIYTSYYPTGKATHKLDKRLSEGYATLVQKYVEMPQTITNLFPDLVNSMLKPEGEFYSENVGAMLKDLKGIVEDYQAMSALDQIGAVRTSDINKTNKADFLNFWEKVRTEVADNIYPLEKLGKKAGQENTVGDPSLWARMYNASNTVIINNLKGSRGFWVYKNGEFVKTQDYNYGTLLKRLEKEKTFDSFGDYLIARDQHFEFQRLAELKKEADKLTAQAKDAEESLKDIEGLTKEDIADAKQSLGQSKVKIQEYLDLKEVLTKNGFTEQQVTKAYEENQNRFKEEEEVFDSLVKEDLEFLHSRDIGLVNDEKYNELVKRKGYASLKREFYDEIVGDGDVQSSTPGGTKVSSMKGRTGSSRTIIHPLHSAMKNHSESTKKGLKQLVYNKVVAISDQFPELFQRQQLKAQVDDTTGAITFSQEKDPNIIMGRIDYKRVPVLTDNFIKKIVDDVLDHQNVHILEKIIVSGNRFFTKGTTAAYPAFVLTNIPVDQVTALVQTQTGYIPIWSAIQELSKAIKSESVEAKYLQEYLVLGGDRQTFIGWQNMSSTEVAEAIAKERKGILKVIDFLNTGADVLSMPAQYSEIMTRATEFIRARKQGRPQVVALELAGRVTAPFHHIGRLGGGSVGKTAIKSIPFFSPSIQVLDQTIRILETPEGRRKYGFVLAAITAALISGAALIQSTGSEKQKRMYADLNSDELAMYMWYPNSDGETLGKVRIPQNVAVAGSVINMALNDKKLQTNYSFGEYVATGTSFLPTQLNPTDIQQMLLSWIPQIAKPAVEVAANYRSFPKVMPLESMGQKYKEPGQRYTDSTSKLAKWLGGELNLSPIKIDALTTGYLGRASGFITQKPGVWNPFTTLEKKEFFDGGRAMQTYYDAKKKNDEQSYSIKHKTGDYTVEEKSAINKTKAELKVINKYIDIYRNVDEEKNPDKAEVYRQKIYKKIQDNLVN